MELSCSTQVRSNGVVARLGLFRNNRTRCPVRLGPHTLIQPMSSLFFSCGQDWGWAFQFKGLQSALIVAADLVVVSSAHSAAQRLPLQSTGVVQERQGPLGETVHCLIYMFSNIFGGRAG